MSRGITLNGVVYDRVLMNEDAKHSDLALNERATTLLEELVCLDMLIGAHPKPVIAEKMEALLA